MSYQVLSASAADRANLCEGSFALPFEKPDPGFFAERGTYVHSYLERAIDSEEEGETFRIMTRSEYLRCLAAAIDTEGIFRELNAV